MGYHGVEKVSRPIFPTDYDVNPEVIGPISGISIALEDNA
jgi:hypothetical protein